MTAGTKERHQGDPETGEHEAGRHGRTPAAEQGAGADREPRQGPILRDAGLEHERRCQLRALRDFC